MTRSPVRVWEALGLKTDQALHPSPAETRAPRLVAAPRRAGGALRRASWSISTTPPTGRWTATRPGFSVISATSGEGTTTIARELAGAVAETVGRRALLLTIMLRNLLAVRSLDAVLRGDIPLRAGLDEAERRFPFHCGLVDCRAIEPQPRRAPGVRSLFEGLLSVVEVIIIDSPPALTEFAGLALVRHVAGVILVVEAERTRYAGCWIGQDA